MKLLYKKFILSAYIAFFFSGYAAFSQDAQKGDLNIALSYFTDNNKLPYISVKVKTKVKGRFTNVSDIPLKLYLNNDSAGNLIKAVVTNDKGEAAAIIPPSLKNQWNGSLKHSFLATFDGDKKFEPAKADLSVGRAKILIDTTGDKKIVAKVEDNDQYGNLLIEKTVPWGAKFIPVNSFDKRTLFATSGKAPVWLLLIVGSIVISVWGVLILLVINLFKIKKLGVEL